MSRLENTQKRIRGELACCVSRTEQDQQMRNIVYVEQRSRGKERRVKHEMENVNECGAENKIRGAGTQHGG